MPDVLPASTIAKSTTLSCEVAARGRWRRAPAAPIAIAVGAGIITDRFLGLALPLWLAGGFVALAGWYVAFRLQRRASVVWLLALTGVAGGAWHHVSWSTVEPDHVVRYSRNSYEPVRLRGTIVNHPRIVPPAPQELPVAIPQFDRTICTVQCAELLSCSETMPVSGDVRLEVTGHLLHAGVGDIVDIVGRFGRPAPASNPGGFDVRAYLRNFKLLTVVRCGEPDDVRVLQSAADDWRRWQGRLRKHAERLIGTSLSEQTAPVGLALLLGARTNIPDELATAFAESGTMHILAISGANVGILASLLWLIAEVAGLRRAATAVLVLAGILGYAFLADAQTPVVRGVLMFIAALSGRPWRRSAGPANALSLAALGVFVWNPAHLFELSAQLSFLAVGALIWATTWLPRFWFSAPSLATGADSPGSYLGFRLQRLGYTAMVAIGMLAAVWLFTLPLGLARFHLFAPIGFLANAVLSPLVALVLSSGYALLVAGLLVPAAALPFAWAFDTTLAAMLWLIERAAAVPGGHYYAAGPGEGWLIGYYLFLALGVAGWPGSRLRVWGWRALGLWAVSGLGLSFVPTNPGELRCSFLSVGHGLAVLIEMPNGRTLVYDAGRLQDGRRAADTVQQALWQLGHDHIDALVVSHADIDHFNGVPKLARTARIGTAFMHRTLLDFEQAAVRGLCDALAREQTPIRLAAARDRLQLDPDVVVQVIQPEHDAADSLDNANSLVLEIEYAGRRILLTGDLEQQGLRRLLERPSRNVDVLLAPHHGSPNANPRALAEWANAEFVVVSGGRKDAAASLRTTYEGAQVLSTAVHGAVSFVVTSDGKLRTKTFVNDDLDSSSRRESGRNYGIRDAR